MAEQRYLRNLNSISEEEQNTLLNSKVFIAGSGGLGGHILAHLLRIGIGSVTLIDSDTFDVTNLNRQLLCTTENIHLSKTDTALRYASAVNPSVKITAYQTRLTKENCSSLIQGHDLVLDAFDNIESRRILAAGCDELAIPYVYGGICGWSAQVGVFPPGTAAHRIAQLYPEKAALTDKSCLAFTPAVCASMQCAEAVKYLLHKGHPLTDRILYLDLLENEFEYIPFFK